MKRHGALQRLIRSKMQLATQRALLDDKLLDDARRRKSVGGAEARPAKRPRTAHAHAACDPTAAAEGAPPAPPCDRLPLRPVVGSSGGTEKAAAGGRRCRGGKAARQQSLSRMFGGTGGKGRQAAVTGVGGVDEGGDVGCVTSNATWPCASCTFDNKPLHLRCDACVAMRPPAPL